ncbi:hypothetical protein P168DRAFT_284164 [Aspergillus campestris IBT 28561]|uniref:Uncharacterized protein n=1 Tax=Aspergillus campestris (strain IBT 28561) TaxID=1392248 RepID=A0A2I1CUU9_ASPC2|nr:uncharacterized protein P168DRAFT_284164 [Aspergillus campestris IBT 28561]PKY01403.1 hypothetical protein P168DRAFT_284164 [Aspergillus campestris IBT 28561]
MFNPNAPNPRRPSHSLNTPVPILIDSDEEISDADNESENESGSENDSMQVDEYPQHQTRETGGYNLAGLDPTMQFSPADPRVRGHRQHHHHPHPHHQHGTYHTSIEQEKKVRSRLREERHAALCVLMDRELLTIQALAAQETLPQARRRFLSKLMAPEDADIAASIRADRFTIQPNTTTTSSSSTQKRHRPSSPSAPQSFVTSSASSGSTPITVHRKIVDAYGVDDDGWKRPEPVVPPGSASRSGGRTSSGSASPAPSFSGSLRRENTTPSKGRAVSGSGSGSGSGAGSGSASRRLQRERELERRRREGFDDYDGDEGVF